MFRELNTIPRLKYIVLALCLVSSISLTLVTNVAHAATTVAITSPSNGSSTTGSSFTITGTASPARNITVKVNGAAVGTTTSDGSGNWSLDVTGQSAGVKTIEATASYQKLYVNSLNGASLSNSVMTKINTVDNSVEGTFSLFSGGQAPLFWVPNGDFTKAYGAAGPLGSPLVYVIDLVNESTTSFLMAGSTPKPSGVAYNADDSKVYMNDFNSSNDIVHVYNTTTNVEIGSGIAVGDIASSSTRRPGTNEIWVTNSGDHTISIIDTVTDTVVDTYAFAGPVSCLSFNDDGSKGYGTECGSGSNIYVIDGETGATTDTIAASGAIGYVSTVDHDDSKLYVPILSGNSLDIYDASTDALIQNVPGLNGPLAATISDDDSKLYISNAQPAGGFTGTTVSVLDTSNNSITDTITVGRAPSVPFLAPLESATTSIDITLTTASSTSTDTLADTGQNTTPITILATILLTSGLAVTTYTYYKQKGRNV